MSARTLLLLLSIVVLDRPLWAAPPGAIAARVNGQEISTAEVDAALASAMRGRELEPTVRPKLQAETLTQLIDRRLVLEALGRSGDRVGAKQADDAIDKMKAQFGGDEKRFAKYVTEQHSTLASLREQLLWQLSWQNYLLRQLTDGNLEKFFDAHRRDFDGTQVRVSHLLLGADRNSTAAADRLAEAARIRGEIDQGKLTFAQAVQKHSTGPSRSQDGDLGLIPRHGVMDEAFSQAAFALEKGQLSPPVVTPFGVHLILATEIQPGKKSWLDVRETLRTEAARYLFDRLARAERENARIEFTGAVPHFKPGTRELAAP